MNFLDDEKEPFSEQNISFKNHVIRYSLLIIVVNMSLDALQNVLKIPINFAALAVTIYLMSSASREHRNNDLGGLISFKRAFTVSFLTSVLSSIFTTIYGFVALHFFMKDEVLSNITEIRSTQNDNPMAETIAQALELLLTPIGFIVALLANFAFYALICLIIATVQKRNSK